MDLVDIAIHCAVALAWAVLCGVAYAWGYEVPALIALLLGIAFWIVRELRQHDWEFRFHWRSQSMWEWVAPAVVSIVAGVTTVIVERAIT